MCGTIWHASLEKTNNDIQEDDGSDDATFNVVVGAKAESHGDDQNQGQAVGDLSEEDSPPDDTARSLQLVRAILLMTTGHFAGGQTIPSEQSQSRRCIVGEANVLDVGAEKAGYTVGRQGVSMMVDVRSVDDGVDRND